MAKKRKLAFSRYMFKPKSKNSSTVGGLMGRAHVAAPMGSRMEAQVPAVGDSSTRVSPGPNAKRIEVKGLMHGKVKVRTRRTP